MSYAEKYQLQYTDLDGNVIKIVISQKDYVGAVSNLIGSENPSESGLDKQNDDRFETLKPTYLKLNFFVDTAGDFDEFYDIDNFEYLVTKYINTVPEWSGFISDEVFQEPYSSGKYIINLTAIDGLCILKGRYTVLTGRKSHMEMIRECLDAIGLGLNIVDGIEAVELGHSASGGPLSQTYFDANLFADKDGKRWTLDKILKDILTTYGANIVQVHNKWVISSIESYFDGVSGWEYTSAGEYVGEYQNIEEKAITAKLGDDQVTLLTGGTIQKRKGWKELSVKTTFGKIEQEGIILNGSFNIHPGYSAGDDYSANTSHELLLTGWDHSDSLAPFPHMGVKIRTNQATGDYVYIKEPGITESAYYIQTFLNDAKPLLASSSKLYVFSFMYAMLADAMLFSGKQKGKLKVEVVNDEGVTTHWLAKDPTWWATSETFIETPEVTLYTKDAFDWTQGVLNIIGFPGGRIRVTLYSENKLASFQYSGIAWDEILFYSKEVSQAPDRGVLTGYPTDNPNLVTIPSELEFMQTDAPVENPEDAVLFFKNYLSLSDGTPTSSWSTTHHSGTLAQIYLYACLEAHGKAIQVKNTPGRGLISPLTRLQAGAKDHGGKKFQIVSYSHRDKINQFTAEIIEIIEPGTIPITTNFTGDESSSGGSGGNGETTATTEPTTDDRLVAMLEEDGLESGAPGKLYGKYHDFEGVGSTLAYYPMGMGIGNYDAFHDYKETIAGMYATLGTGQADYWCATCRLFTIGDGKDAEHRSNAFTMYKSGYAEFTNAIVLGAYLWRDPLVGPPWDGSMQYITDGNYWSFQGYYNGAWHDFIMDDSFYYINLMDTPSSYGAVGTFPFMDTADTLGWSAYTMPIGLPDVDSVPVITSAGTSSWQPYSGGGGGDAWLLGGNTLGQKDYLGSVDNYAIAFKTNDIERMSIGTDGLVNPLFNVRLEDTSHTAEVGIIYKGAVPFIHNFNYGHNGIITTLGHNIFIGENAGNLTMGSTAGINYFASNNIIIGYQSLYSNTLGYNNIVIGSQAAYSNTTGSNNVFIGYNTAYSNTIGGTNVAIGDQSLYNNVINGANVAIGYQSLYNSDSSYNTAVGSQAAYSITTGTYNTAVGYKALNKNTSSHYHTAVGSQAAYSNTTGIYITAIGYKSLYSNVTGGNNTAVGYQSLYSNVTGGNNTAVGYQSLYSNTSASNTAVGYKALYSNTTGFNNTIIGLEAGRDLKTGNANVSIGNYALRATVNSSASYNVAIGHQTLYNVTTASENVAIGYASLNYCTTGGLNTAIGNYSGVYIADDTTTLTLTNKSIFVGANTKAKANNSTNEIVIGYNTIGNGSNTVTIGNTSITDNFLNGNLQIGNKFKILEGGTTPTYFSIFQGGDQLTDLTYTLPTAYPGASGYVLSSTDAGVLSWIEMSTSTAYWKRDGVTNNYYIESAEMLFIEQPSGTDPFGYIFWGDHTSGGSGLAYICSGYGVSATPYLLIQGASGAQILMDEFTEITGGLYLNDPDIPLFFYDASELEIGMAYHLDGQTYNAMIIQMMANPDDSSAIEVAAFTEVGQFGLFNNPYYWNGISWEEIHIDIFQNTNIQTSTDGYVATIVEDSSGNNSVQWMPVSGGSSYWTEDSLGVHYNGDVYLTGRLFNDFSGNDEILLDSFFDSVIQSATTGYVATITEVGGVKSISWVAGGGGSCYWTEDSDGLHYDGDVYIHDIYYDQSTPDRYELDMLRASNINQAQDGYVLTVNESSGGDYLSWAPAGAGSCYWSSVAGGITYNNNAYVYSDGYLALDNAILISPCSHSGYGNGTLQYNTSGRFAGRYGLQLFHDSYWQDLVEWNDNYLVNLIDVYTLGTPASDAVLVVHSNRTVDYTLLSSLGGSKWTADSYGIHYSSGNVGIGTDSDYIYKFTVSSSGYCIQGLSGSGVGVMGSSTSGAGVIGNSSSNYGVEGVSQTNYGVYGSSAYNYGGVFAGLGVDISSGGLFMGGTNVINSSRVADFASLKIGGTERIDSSGNVKSANGLTTTYTDVNGHTLTFTNGILTAQT